MLWSLTNTVSIRTENGGGNLKRETEINHQDRMLGKPTLRVEVFDGVPLIKDNTVEVDVEKGPEEVGSERLTFRRRQALSSRESPDSSIGGVLHRYFVVAGNPASN
jgi:hypothetical protein